MVTMALSPEDLASMRDAVAATLTDRAQVLRAQRVPDDLGGFVDTWEEEEEYPCRVSPVGFPASRAMEQVVAGRLTSDQAWVATLPAGARARVGDRLVIGGRLFTITGLDAGRTGAVCVRAMIEPVE